MPSAKLSLVSKKTTSLPKLAYLDYLPKTDQYYPGMAIAWVIETDPHVARDMKEDYELDAECIKHLDERIREEEGYDEDSYDDDIDTLW